MKEKNVRLSASRIKSYKDCSWKYWCNYHLGLPRTGNDGTSRGTACHLILEVLLNPRHQKYISVMMDKSNAYTIKSIEKLVEKSLRKDGFYSEENMKLCNIWILVGLSCDYLGGKGAKITEPEKEFLIESEEPNYTIYGLIDKPIEYPKNKTLKIVDYKTTKSKPPKAEIEFNIQALCYLLASRKLWPKLKKRSVEFQYLKFPDDPFVKIEVTDEDLDGFEYYLEHVNEILNDFDEESAESNFASKKKFPKKDEGFTGPLQCGFAEYPGELKKDGDPKWHCEYKFPFDYYVAINKKGEKLKSAYSKEDLKKPKGGKIEKRHYEGCPAHSHLLKKLPQFESPEPKAQEKRDDFDF
tara:strand:- start:30247 stop:31308 length:1062 start_codon:yes stop_codon:yes gene_type:complete